MNVNRCGWLNEWNWSLAHCVDWWTVVGALAVVDYKQPQKRRNEAGQRRIVAAGVDKGD